MLSTPTPLNSTSPFIPILQEFVNLRVDPYVQEGFLWLGFDALPKIVPLNNETDNSTANVTSFFKKVLETRFLYEAEE